MKHQGPRTGSISCVFPLLFYTFPGTDIRVIQHTRLSMGLYVCLLLVLIPGRGPNYQRQKEVFSTITLLWQLSRFASYLTMSFEIRTCIGILGDLYKLQTQIQQVWMGPEMSNKLRHLISRPAGAADAGGLEIAHQIHAQRLGLGWSGVGPEHLSFLLLEPAE